MGQIFFECHDCEREFTCDDGTVIDLDRLTAPCPLCSVEWCVYTYDEEEEDTQFLP